MARLRLPSVLRPLAGGAATLDVPAGSLGTLRERLRAEQPGLAERLYEPGGGVREFVNLFLDGADARGLADDHPLSERSEVVVLPAVSGGS